MRIKLLFALLTTFTFGGVAHAESSADRARTTIILGIPSMDVDLSYRKYAHISVGFLGVGLSHKWSNGLYASTYATALINPVDEWGKSLDLNVGWSINLNANKHDSWLFNIIPQLGYRYAERWIYYRDGFGPRNQIHAVLFGASYEFYSNSDMGIVFRAHSFFEAAPYSVINPEVNYGQNFDDEVLRFGIDLGLSLGISFGH